MHVEPVAASMVYRAGTHIVAIARARLAFSTRGARRHPATTLATRYQARKRVAEAQTAGQRLDQLVVRGPPCGHPRCRDRRGAVGANRIGSVEDLARDQRLTEIFDPGDLLGVGVGLDNP